MIRNNETGFGFSFKKLQHIAHSPWAGGAILVLFVIIALVLANSEATSALYHHILTTPLSLAIGEEGQLFHFSLDIEKFINDGLMVVFFFVVGLEIKRELLFGQLSSMKQAMLPIVAAVGGMVVPAAIYAIFNVGGEYVNGWGIPMATDIAFAIAILSLMGDKVPAALKVFLTALAIVDDLGAIVVIAIFYTYKINLLCLGLIAVLLIVLCIFRKKGVTQIAPYLGVAVVVWFLFYQSGVHATISGVIMAMMIPNKPRLSKKEFLQRQVELVREFKKHDREGVEVVDNEALHHDLLEMRRVATDSIGMSQRMEHLLHSWITFLVMPIFALANSGVEINSSSLGVFSTSLGWGILGGLVLGKPIGIFLASWLAVKFKIAVLPKGSHWIPLLGVACVGGIGFTMSIFIDTLAFAGAPVVAGQAKIVILAASTIAALLGFVVINGYHYFKKLNNSVKM
jgi:NhaA family Na+:H+ antiporter